MYQRRIERSDTFDLRFNWLADAVIGRWPEVDFTVSFNGADQLKRC